MKGSMSMVTANSFSTLWYKIFMGAILFPKGKDMSGRHAFIFDILFDSVCAFGYSIVHAEKQFPILEHRLRYIQDPRQVFLGK